MLTIMLALGHTPETLRYERKARVTPGLLLALPLLVPLVAVYGPKNAVLTGILAVLGGCGAIFALDNIARGRGKRLEEALVRHWGVPTYDHPPSPPGRRL